MEKTSWLIGAILIVLLLVCVCACCVLGAGVWLYSFEGDNGVVVTLPPDVVTPWGTTAPVTPPAIEPVSDAAIETLHALREAQVPVANIHDLGVRFRGVPASTPRTLEQPAPDYPVGARRTFNVSNVDTDQQFEIVAVMLYKTEHVYMWVEEGVNVDERRLREAANLFTEHSYPTNREFFGTEWNPGVDNDPRLSILHARGLGNTVAGYFSSPDSYVRAVRPDSNEMEMFYINIQNVRLGDDFYNGVLAHEFQHMIHWYNDLNEETWLNEGCSELAMELNARTYDVPGTYDVGGSEYSYLNRPDTQLTTWPEGTAGSAAANYGGSYLFMAYFLDRFGEDTTRDLVAHDANGMESFDLVLADEGLAITHKDLFADWSIANLLDNADVGEGQYHYAELSISDPRIDVNHRASDYPVERTTNVSQYGVDYIEIEGNAPLQFSFSGQSEVRVVDAEAHSGQYLWWSNRDDESYTRLNRVVDLRDASAATLRFWTWYHIEEDWDYAYLAIGTTANGVIPADYNDTSITWQILDDRTLNCTTSDPNGNSFGCGWTGESNGWKQLSADLTPFVGQQVLISFQYITDAAVNQPGFAVDDVEIEADGQVIFSDDMESGVGDWVAEGFVRHANILPQEWIVQLVTYGSQTQVQRLLFADSNTGTWTIPLSGNTRKAIIAISALAPTTTQKAAYQYTLTQE